MITAVRARNGDLLAVLYMAHGRSPEEENPVPFGEARIAREGTTSPHLLRRRSTCAARGDKLEEEDDISAEVIDLRSLRPFDEETIIESVKKTHRAVAVQEQWRYFGVASEVAAIIQDKAFDYLDAPVERVSGAETPAPFARNLELAAFPSEDMVADAARRVLYEKVV